MTCNVLMGTLNPTHSLTHSFAKRPPPVIPCQRMNNCDNGAAAAAVAVVNVTAHTTYQYQTCRTQIARDGNI